MSTTTGNYTHARSAKPQTTAERAIRALALEILDATLPTAAPFAYRRVFDAALCIQGMCLRLAELADESHLGRYDNGTDGPRL